jgi:hypothetical protein
VGVAQQLHEPGARVGSSGVGDRERVWSGVRVRVGGGWEVDGAGGIGRVGEVGVAVEGRRRRRVGVGSWRARGHRSAGRGPREDAGGTRDGCGVVRVCGSVEKPGELEGGARCRVRVSRRRRHGRPLEGELEGEMDLE